jgi:phytoene dehydrogenase-like protein
MATVRGAEPRSADVVVAGGSLAGLVAGAVLARRGYKVVALESTDHLGSRVGSREFNGYWIDWGHRDGHGVGDISYVPYYTKKAAEAAGFTAPLTPLSGDHLRVHWLPEERTTDLPMSAVVGAGTDPVERMKALSHGFGVAPEREDVVAQTLVEVLGKLATMDDEEAWRLVPVRLEDWLLRNVADPDVRRVILQQNELAPLGPNESLGRYVFHLRTFASEPEAVVIDHEEIGGVQGLVAAFTNALEAAGGEVWLNWKPTEIVIRDNIARGVVALDESSMVQEFEAPVVITDYPGSRLSELVDPDELPADFLKAAHDAERYGREIISWWAGLDRLPHRRGDGSVEDHSSPWHRVFRSSGGVQHVGGGWLFPSAFSRKQAPAGKHLLHAWFEPTSESSNAKWGSWGEARSSIDGLVDYIHRYYSDLEDCTAWSRYQYVSRPAWLAWYMKPVYRHPIKIGTVEGLYVGSATAEGTGGFLDVECAAGLEAAQIADAENNWRAKHGG